MAYAVLINERHSDIDVELFSDADVAVERAREIAEDFAEGRYEIDEELNDTMRGFGWLYHAAWGPEGDHLFVVERSVG